MINGGFRHVCTVLLVALLLLCAGAACAAGPDPVDILFLRGNIEIGFGQPVPLDQTLVKKLEKEGFRVHLARDFNPLTMRYLRQFEVVVWVGISPAYAESRLYSPVGWQGGMHMLTVRENAELLQKYAREGGGLLLNPGVEEMGMQVVPSHRRILDAYGMATECAQVRDVEHQVEFYKVINRYPYHLSYTENVTEHPVTEGVNRIWYPAYTMRWDDNITTIPLYPRDEAWTSLVKPADSATVSWFRGTPYEEGHWKDRADQPEFALAAARPFGKGRVGVIGIGHFHLFYYPYSADKNHREVLFGPQKGVLMENGLEDKPAELAVLMNNFYRWLAASSRQAGIGGYNPEDPVALPEIPDRPVTNRADVWAADDPLVEGEVRPMRILVGARTARSDGSGTVADYARAAKDAGYDVVAFTETFEYLEREEYEEFVRECRRLSDDEVHLLPGIDVADKLGNRFLLLGKDTFIRPHLRVESEAEEPGDRLIWTGHMLIGMGEVLPVAARPERLATEREHGALPPDLYSHCPGVAVATYRGGRPVDDGLSAYKWHLYNATIPIPVAVHEVFSPEDVARAAETGLQTCVNGDTPRNVAGYFRQGHMSFGGNPMRSYLSSGPVAESYDIDDWRADPWTVTLGLRGDAPITDVRVHDQRSLYRHFRPNTRETEVSWRGNQGAQHWFFVEARDADGGRAIMSPLRTLPGARAFVRCMDRQNWFSGLHFGVGVNYTGRLRSLPLDVRGAPFRVPGVRIGGKWAPKLQLTYNGPSYTVVDYLFDATVESRGRPLGADSAPIFNCRPVDEFEGNLRFWFYMGRNHRSSRPQYTVYEPSVTLRQDLAPEGDVWPVLWRVKKGATATVFDDAKGQWRSVEPPTEGTVELPAGAHIGSVVLLDPLHLDAHGHLGPTAPKDGKRIGKGTSWSPRLLRAKKLRRPRLTALGFGGQPRYDLEMTRGTLRAIRFGPQVVAEAGGVAGHITGKPDLRVLGPEQLAPIELHGGNPNWPLGLWAATDGQIHHYDYLDEVGRGRIQLNRDTNFYFGSLVTATAPELRLAFAEPWTEEQAVVAVHNPTDHPITATVATPPEIRGYRRLEKGVTVGAGKTVVIGKPAR